MANLDNKTRVGNISIYHECIPRELADHVNELFAKARNNNHTYDGITGCGLNKELKDSKDLIPYWSYPVDNEFRQVSELIQQHVVECIVDYFTDNPQMFYSIDSAKFLQHSYDELPNPATILARCMSVQKGQYQYYPVAGKAGWSPNLGGGYPSNHAESSPHVNVQSERLLTWMMTLNDLPVTEEQYGYTVFTGQNIAVRPQAGQLVLFSPWQDCEHRGNRVNDVEKSIVTSWVAHNAPHE